uniref:protein STPG4 isoform X5 n=1 Tax=Pristiophorus japonicus TaxID=55135 RepID=UPI00398E4D3D
MATAASNPPTEKIARKKPILTNKLKIKPKVKEISNPKNSRKQKANSLVEERVSTRGGWWQENVKGTLSAASYNLRTPVFERSSARFGKVDFSSLSSQGTFRSSVKRFPTIYFVPKEGPAPGQYNVKHQTLSPIMTSSFLSKVPRFLPSPSKTPGPGTYEPIRQLPSWTEAASDLLY